MGNRQYAMVVDGAGRHSLRSKSGAAPIQAEPIELADGRCAWRSAANGRLLIPRDQVIGRYAMSEAEFERLPIGSDALLAADDFERQSA